MVNIDNKTDELRKRIKKIIKEYDNQGIHRTGTKVDDNSAESVSYTHLTLPTSDLV